MLLDKFILGTAQFGLSYGINNSNGQIPLDDSISLLNSAFSAGITQLDTAEAYGNAHEVIGSFHRHYLPIRFNILTKLPNGFEGGINNKIVKYIEQLQVDTIEGCSFHSFNSYIDTMPLVRDELNNLKKSGKIGKIGVSIYTNKEAEVAIEDPMIDIIQMPFNLFDNYNLRGTILEKAKRLNTEVHVRSCFLQGLFFMDPESDNPIAKALKSELSKIRDIARKYNLSIQELALHYVFGNPMIGKVLIGVDNWPQLAQNILALEQQVPQEALWEIEEIEITNIDLINPTLWRELT